MAHIRQRRIWMASICTILLTACQTLPPPPPPEGSVLPANLTRVEADRGYFLDHEYVRDALAYGNQGFQKILSHNGELARQSFVKSTNLLAEGLAEHKKFAKDRAQTQRTFADIFKVGLMALGTAVAYKARSSANTGQQLQAVDAAFSNFLDASNSLGAFIQDQIRLGELGSSAVRTVDKNQWRAAVVADHRLSRSIVRVFNDTKFRGSNPSTSSCTGFFVAPYVIMTAAHCFEIGDALGAYRQIPADGKAFMTGEEEHIEIEMQYRGSYDDRARAKTRPYDMAFLLTKKPSESYLPISTRPLRMGEKLMSLGYSGDLNNGYFLRIDYGCKVTSFQQADSFRTNCITYGGNSGGPILAVDGEVAVVGVHHGSYRRTEGHTNDNGYEASMRQAAALFRMAMNHPASKGRIQANPFE
ncbi:trypsin-like serine protease [Bordetella petrii]|nr:trypsin-like serine protease [Bordetella petrii]